MVPAPNIDNGEEGFKSAKCSEVLENVVFVRSGRKVIKCRQVFLGKGGRDCFYMLKATGPRMRAFQVCFWLIFAHALTRFPIRKYLCVL